MKTLMSTTYKNPIKEALNMVNKEIDLKEKQRSERIKKNKFVKNNLAAKRRNNLRKIMIKRKIAAKRNKRKRYNNGYGLKKKKFNSRGGENELFDLYKAPNDDLSIPDLNNPLSLDILDYIENPAAQKKPKLSNKEMMKKLNIPHLPILNPSFRSNKNRKRRMIFPKLGHRGKKVFKPTFLRLRKVNKRRAIPKNKFNDLFNSDGPFSQHRFTNSELHAETPTHHIISKVQTQHHKIPKYRTVSVNPVRFGDNSFEDLNNINRPVTIDPVKFAQNMGFFKKKLI